MAKKKAQAAEKKEIKIRVTPKDYDRIKEKADAKAMSLQEYVTTAALNRREKKPEYKEYPPVLLEWLEYHQREVALLNKNIRELIEVSDTDENIWYSLLEDMAVSMRTMCQHETMMYMSLLGGEIYGNFSTV